MNNDAALPGLLTARAKVRARRLQFPEASGEWATPGLGQLDKFFIGPTTSGKCLGRLLRDAAVGERTCRLPLRAAAIGLLASDLRQFMISNPVGACRT
jgi:hypothetical protein